MFPKRVREAVVSGLQPFCTAIRERVTSGRGVEVHHSIRELQKCFPGPGAGLAADTTLV